MNLKQTYLLDSEGLSRAARGERHMGARLRDAERVGNRIVTVFISDRDDMDLLCGERVVVFEL